MKQFGIHTHTQKHPTGLCSWICPCTQQYMLIVTGWFKRYRSENSTRWIKKIKNQTHQPEHIHIICNTNNNNNLVFYPESTTAVISGPKILTYAHNVYTSCQRKWNGAWGWGRGQGCKQSNGPLSGYPRLQVVTWFQLQGTQVDKTNLRSFVLRTQHYQGLEWVRI